MRRRDVYGERKAPNSALRRFDFRTSIVARYLLPIRAPMLFYRTTTQVRRSRPYNRSSTCESGSRILCEKGESMASVEGHQLSTKLAQLPIVHNGST
jgi:hypothetical protein